MKRTMTAAVIGLSALALAACGTETRDDCEWEQKKPKKASEAPLSYFGKGGTGGGGGGGGSRGGGSRGGSGGSGKSRSGSKSYTKNNPPPRPATPAKPGYVWVVDCD